MVVVGCGGVSLNHCVVVVVWPHGLMVMVSWCGLAMLVRWVGMKVGWGAHCCVIIETTTMNDNNIIIICHLVATLLSVSEKSGMPCKAVVLQSNLHHCRADVMIVTTLQA